MAQSGTDQHQGRFTVREGTHHTGTAADLPVQPFDHIVGADSAWECGQNLGLIMQQSQDDVYTQSDSVRREIV